MHTLATKCHKNLAGINSEILYSHQFVGRTKNIIHEYARTLEAALDVVAAAPEDVLSHDRKVKFFRSLEKSYGKSALCLSGGGGQGYYHVGVVRALLDRGLLPAVIAGTSAGALIGSIVCTKTDEELRTALTPDLHAQMTACAEPLPKRLFRFLKTGNMFEKEPWLVKTRALIGDWTFEEAYLRTGRVFNVTITSANVHSPPLLLNYITAPNVLVYSAVVASAAIPGLLEACELLVKNDDGSVEPYHVVGEKWTDGGLKTDLPMQSLSHLFNVNYFIVSQVNPHIIPFLYERKGSAGQPVWRAKGVRGGFITALLEAMLKYDMKKWLIVMKELELFPMFLGHDWSLIFLQNFAGSVTISPSPRFSDYLLILHDPTRQRMAEYIHRGQTFTYLKVGMIEVAYRTEKKIDTILQSLGALDMFDTILASPIVRELRLQQEKTNMTIESPPTAPKSPRTVPLFQATINTPPSNQLTPFESRTDSETTSAAVLPMELGGALLDSGDVDLRQESELIKLRRQTIH
ncbi:patatin-like phospholipase domain-containing protein, variant [Capsaspora owczarzaki ATCC 30864]|nr:patatin-like phospholipase domain-containing protein, variant [Capsaspora owczarzaki ATCC 30864]